MKFTKHDGMKSRLDLLPGKAIELVGYALRHGAKEYAPDNWRKCKDPQRYIAALLRHVMQHQDGESTDSDSGLLHLALAATNALFALELFFKLGQDNGMDKRFNYFALIERKSKKRGVVKKRFRSYEAAWKYLTSHELEPSKAIIKTVNPADKVGQEVPL